MNAERWEVGSDLHWSASFLSPAPAPAVFPDGFASFATARGLLTSLLRHLSRGKPVRLHLPSYFCMETAAVMARVCDVRWYRDLPTASAPDFSTLETEPGDCVYVINAFGLRDRAAWRDWPGRAHSTVIEDHTHDPSSDWACASDADYVVVSLRKTLPVADGAVMWSPTGMTLPQTSAPAVQGAGLKLAAMILKDAYLAGSGVTKDAYRALYREAEHSLLEDETASASNFTLGILPFLDQRALRRKRMANSALFFEMLAARETPYWEPLGGSAVRDGAPYNPILNCTDGDIREALRRHLLAHNVYPATHWPQLDDGMHSDDSEAMALSKRLLTIPLDFRYSADDVTRVVQTLQAFAP
jgi:hypothetical protein